MNRASPSVRHGHTDTGQLFRESASVRANDHPLVQQLWMLKGQTISYYLISHFQYFMSLDAAH